ncbi:MAG: formimidoylglutamate deiminase [Gemmatimonadota bacterium]|nr:formimidoylglutamate deiminase [Gemmatimonadota bacterium]
MREDGSLLWAPRAWIGGQWRDAVLLRVGADGHWADVAVGVVAPAEASLLPGPVLPGMVDAHSHAFQRAFAGVAERRTGDHDDFWSWRDRMYDVALRITPAQLRAVAAQLYAELLHGGYTQISEFHYLQHAPDGQPYADPLELSWALAEAASDTGIGLTILPVLYERAGFAEPALRSDQRRFATSADGVLALHRGLRDSHRSLLTAGVAIHSLRAATPAAIARLVAPLGDVPIHIHVAEQTGEVADCLTATGERPIEWLTRHTALDARWQLVHATQSTPEEIVAVARSGAGVVLCPTTEANLGDGLADLPGWLGAGVPLSIGSDSQVTRSWGDELRLVEYGQRLHLRQRNVAASPDQGEPATASRLLERALHGGGVAAGFKRWGLVAGARADLLVIDTTAASLLGIPGSHLLDSLVFSTPGRPFRDVMVGGRWVLCEHRHPREAEIARLFVGAMQELWPG